MPLRTRMLLLAGLLAAGCGGAGDDAPHRPEHRLLIVGWDGASFELVDPLVRAGRLPNLARLIERGRTAQLDSTVVPISSAAWVGAATGGTPGTTGVYDFFEPVRGTYAVRLTSARSNAMPPLWRILGWYGLESLVFGVPLTWPPEEVNGVLVAGMLAPFDAEYAHPPGLAGELRARGFQPDLGIWRDEQQLTPERMSRQLEIKREVLVEMLGERDWDLAMVVFKSLDVLGHRVYDGREDTAVAQWYGALDHALGELLAAAGPDANVIVLSDHGFRAYGRQFFPHAWLVEKGYATRSGDAAGAGPPTGPLATARAEERMQAVGQLDLARTRALAGSAEGNFGGIRLNLRGREPQGAVAPEQAGALLDEIAARLQDEHVPGTRSPLVTRVWRPAELYPGPFSDRLPDLLFETDPSVAVRPVPVARWFVEDTRTFPDHARAGIWVAAGPSIRASRERARYDVFDLAPTALHLLGLPVHQEMTGVARADGLAGGAPRVISGRALAAGRTGRWRETEGAAGQDEVMERLRALGYTEGLEEEPLTMGRFLAIAVPLAVAAVAAFAWRPVLELELLGWDSYPMIAAGRVSGAGELFATFGEELMDGRYPLGRFWRPMAHLSFALDHALWGLEPRGYHATDLILLAAAAALIAALAPRLFRVDGPAAVLAAAGAGLAFALHPLHFEVLPVAPRRADALAVLFTLLALALQMRRARGGGLGWAFGAGVACAAALASKETGAIAVVAVLLLELAVRRGSPLAVLRSGWPALLLTATAFAGRTAVLGGMGGSPQSSLGSGLARAPDLALVYGEWLLFPPTVLRLPSPGVWALVAVVAFAVLALVLARKPGEHTDDPRLGPGAALFLLGAWAACAVLITGTSGVLQGWYAFPLHVPWALTLGLAAGWGLEACRHGPRIAGAAALALALAFTLLGAAGSMLFDEARDFREASRIQRGFLDHFERELQKARPGRTMTVQGCPESVTAIDAEGQQRKIYLVGPYSLEAYADLRLGDGYARVGFPYLPSQRPPSPERVDVVAVPVPLGIDTRKL